MKTVSIIACANNEEKTILPFWREACRVLKGFDFELIFVNDGSTDHTLEEMRKIRDKRITIIDVKIKQSKNLVLPKIAFRDLNEAVVAIDVDMQDDFSELPKMVAMLEKADLIVGERTNRQDAAARVMMSKIYNWLQRTIFGFNLKDANCGLKVYKRETFQSVCRILRRKAQYRFVALICFLNGYNVVPFPIKHQKRHFGKSHYGFERIFDGILDLFFITFFRKNFIFKKK